MSNTLMPYEIDIKIAERVKEVRERSGLSVLDLEKRTGVDEEKIERFEQKGKISLSNLTKLAIALKIEDDLIALFDAPYGELSSMVNKLS